VLQELGGHVILSDISKKCLDICQERFKHADNMEYHLIDDNLGFIIDSSIDCIWSYDVFLHINPTDIEKYVSDFRRILKPGGCAIIHHSNMHLREKNTRMKVINLTTGFRSYMTAEMFGGLVEQNYSLPHFPGDVISVFTKPQIP
jgi:ubiquinone/menaquinone biosynthesis C-methylase UbiE